MQPLNRAPDPEAHRHVLRFEVGAETFAAFREAIDKVRRDSGELVPVGENFVAVAECDGPCVDLALVDGVPRSGSSSRSSAVDAHASAIG